MCTSTHCSQFTPSSHSPAAHLLDVLRRHTTHLAPMATMGDHDSSALTPWSTATRPRAWQSTPFLGQSLVLTALPSSEINRPTTVPLILAPRSFQHAAPLCADNFGLLASNIQLFGQLLDQNYVAFLGDPHDTTNLFY